MEHSDLSKKLSAVLFASGDPLGADKLCEVLGCTRLEFTAAAEELRKELEESTGLTLLDLDGNWQMAARGEYSDAVKAALEKRRDVPLSQAAMETLAIIAYNQPVSRAFIEQVRGVDSSSSVTSLLSRGLIEEAGRLDLPGRPVAFRTTDSFLRVFGLGSLEDLPSIESIDGSSGNEESAGESGEEEEV